jgi:cytochrome c551/c552
MYLAAFCLWADDATEATRILTANCGGCHSVNVKLSGLDLSTRESLLKGGAKGPAVDLSAPEKSILLQAVHRKPCVSPMPPTKALAAAEVALLERWVKEGAPWAGGKVEARPSWWSFKTPVRPEIPANWTGNPVDYFIGAKLREKGMAPVGRAARAALLRRASYDLTG